MKKICTLLFILFTLNLQAQNDKYSSNVESIDSTIKTLYSVISGEKGEARNWELFHYLFYKDAKLIPSGTNKAGKTGARFLSPQGYIDASEKVLVGLGFFEEEIGRKVERFGNIAHVFTTYQAFKSKKDVKPFMRGINSIQLLYDGNRWWILNVYWQAENKKHPLPDKYID